MFRDGKFETCELQPVPGIGRSNARGILLQLSIYSTLVRWQRGKDDMQNAMATASRDLRLLTMRGQSKLAVLIGVSLRI